MLSCSIKGELHLFINLLNIFYLLICVRQYAKNSKHDQIRDFALRNSEFSRKGETLNLSIQQKYIEHLSSAFLHALGTYTKKIMT